MATRLLIITFNAILLTFNVCYRLPIVYYYITGTLFKCGKCGTTLFAFNRTHPALFTDCRNISHFWLSKNYNSACFMWFQSFWAKNFFFQIFQISNRRKSPFVLCFQISNRGKSPFVLFFQIFNRGKSPFVLCLRIPWHAIMLPFHCIRDRDSESCYRHRTSRSD